MSALICVVTVKWGKETYNVDRESAEGGLEVFQAVLQSLTSVAVDKQKLLVKGKVIKDDKTLEAALKKNKKVRTRAPGVLELPFGRHVGLSTRQVLWREISEFDPRFLVWSRCCESFRALVAVADTHCVWGHS